MGKGKHRRGTKEIGQLDRLKHENAKLKKELAQLRRQLDRIDFSRFQNLKELVDKNDRVAEKELEEAKILKLKEKWRCFDCGKGVLKLITYANPAGEYYYRCCDLCGKRTKSQRYTDEIEGVRG